MANFYSMTEILNKVYSGDTLTGFSTDTDILNAVYDSSNNALRISGGGASGTTYNDSSISTAISTNTSTDTVVHSSLSTAISTNTSTDTTVHSSLSTSLSGTQSTVSTLGTVATYNIWVGTQVEYNALGTYSNTTLYYITA